MTKFKTYFNIFPLPDTNEFLGVAADSNDGHIIVTLGRQFVILNISTQKTTRSWSVKETLTSKVVHDKKNQQYAGVFNNHVLRLWDANDINAVDRHDGIQTINDINCTKKIKFQKSIADLITFNNETYVLYRDGSCQLLDVAIETHKNQRENTKEQLALIKSNNIRDARISRTEDDGRLLTYFKTDRQSGELFLVCVYLSSGAVKEVPLRYEQARLVGQAVIDGNDCPMLLTIWSDRRVFLMSLGQKRKIDVPGNFVGMLTDLNVEQNLTLLGLSEHFVAIYGASPGNDGATLLLYNTQFNVVKARQYFKVYFDFSRLWASNQHIILTMGQNVCAVEYEMSKELLADLLGSQNSNDTLRLVDFNGINEDDLLEVGLKFASSDSKPLQLDQHAVKEEAETFNVTAADTFADGKTLAYQPVEPFDAELNALTRLNLDVEVYEIERAHDDLSLTLMANCHETRPQSTIAQVAQQMERCGASQHEITEKLLTVLMKVDRLQDIKWVLQRYSSVSERMLATVLFYALQKYKTQSTHKPTMDIDGAAQPCSEAQELLDCVLAFNFDAAVISGHLRRKINYSHLVLFIEYLINALNNRSFVSAGQHRRYDSPPVPHEIQWFGALQISHFNVMADCRDPKLINLIKQWGEILDAYKKLVKDTVEFLAEFQNSLNFSACETTEASKMCSIEDIVA